MADHVVDTNVLKVASHADPASGWKKSEHVPPSQRRVVLNWLRAFAADAERRMVLDRKNGIRIEYRGERIPPSERMTPQDYGLQVYHRKLTMGQVAFVEVAYERDSTDNPAIVAETLASFDNSDKKMIAAHLRHKEDGYACTIVNSCDTDWHEHEEMLKAHEVEVHHLMDTWCRDKVYEKYPERKPPDWVFTKWDTDKDEAAKKGAPAPRKGK